MPQVILAIDQGTTGTTVFVVDARGRIRGRAYAEIRQFYPKPGWVEHDPEEIYRSVVTLSKKAISAAKVPVSAIAGIGITNQRETFVVWDRRSGRPVYRAIVWQCRRSAEICDALRDREPEVAQHTGLLVDPYFSGTKLKWLLDNKPELRERGARGDLCFGTIDTWLLYKLSRGAAFVTDYTNASRTMLFNLARREWDDEMLAMLDVPREMLPRAVSSRGPLAETAPGTIAPHAIPIAAVIGDQQSALYGQGAVARRRLEGDVWHRRVPADEHRRPDGAVEESIAHDLRARSRRRACVCPRGFGVHRGRRRAMAPRRPQAGAQGRGH